MVRPSKLALALVVIGVSVGIGLAYAGMIESIVTPEQLPGPPPVAGLAVFGVLVMGVFASGLLDRRAWKQLGANVGLTGGPRFESGPPDKSDKGTLRGTVQGRPVRARTYSTGGGNTSSNKTFTVVEAELQRPVEWHAVFGSEAAPEETPDNEMNAAQVQNVDGMRVRGAVPEALAQDVLTPRVREAIASVEGPVAVGDMKANVVEDMMDQLDDAEGLGGTIAKGMMSVATDGEEAGASHNVQHRARGIVTDEAVLERRIEAVTAVADAVDRGQSAAR